MAGMWFGGRTFCRRARSTSTTEGWLIGRTPGYWAQWFMPVVSVLRKQMQEDQEVQTMKLKSFCKAKAIVNLVKRQPAEWEKTFPSIHLIHKYLKYTKN